jgi:hypothetical protein
MADKKRTILLGREVFQPGMLMIQRTSGTTWLIIGVNSRGKTLELFFNGREIDIIEEAAVATFVQDDPNWYVFSASGERLV